MFCTWTVLGKCGKGPPRAQKDDFLVAILRRQVTEFFVKRETKVLFIEPFDAETFLVTKEQQFDMSFLHRQQERLNCIDTIAVALLWFS